MGLYFFIIMGMSMYISLGIIITCFLVAGFLYVTSLKQQRKLFLTNKKRIINKIKKNQNQIQQRQDFLMQYDFQVYNLKESLVPQTDIIL